MQAKGLLSVLALILLALGLIFPQAALAGNWTFTKGSLNTARMYHTLTRLANGRVLAAGGTSNGSNYLTSCEIYDPATGLWTTTGSLLGNGRIFHKAVLLPNGKVLVAGGYTFYGLTNTAQIFDPAANSGAGGWITTDSLKVARQDHSCTLLAAARSWWRGALATADS